MTNAELNDKLFKKMSDEQEVFKKHLLRCSPEEVLNHANEYAVREDILIEMGALDLSDAQAKALLESPDAMSDIYKDFSKLDTTSHMNEVRECIEGRADSLIQKKQELYATPLYLESYQYADEHGELEQYRASHNANVACMKAVEAAIAEHYHDNRLSVEAAKEVVAAFGIERTSYITAITIQSLESDARIGHEAREWAKTVPVVYDVDSHFHNRNAFLVARHSHPGLIDLFAHMVHDEAAIRQPLYKKTADHARKYGKLDQYKESYRANVVCRREIEEAIFEKRDSADFTPDTIRGFVERFGVERISYVLASTIQSRSLDGQFSGGNTEWAQSVPLYETEGNRRHFIVGGSPAKLDAFVSLFRQEAQTRAQPRRAARKPSIKAQLAAAKAEQTAAPPAQNKQTSKEVR